MKRNKTYFLLENERVITAFEKYFPKQLVRSNPIERNLEVTEEVMSSVFDCLNKLFFNNKLVSVKLVALTVHDTIPFLVELLGKKVNISKIENTLGFYFSRADVDTVNKSYVVIPETRLIYIQLPDDKKVSFGYLISVMLHEMIHLYDELFGDLNYLYYLRDRFGVECNEHETVIFRRFMEEALDSGILIKKDFNGKTFDESNEDAQKYFLNLPIGEIHESITNTGNQSETMMSVKMNDETIAHILF